MAKQSKRARNKRRAREMAIARKKPPPPTAADDLHGACLAVDFDALWDAAVLLDADVIIAAAKDIVFRAESAGRLADYPDDYVANIAGAIDVIAAATDAVCPPDAYYTANALIGTIGVLLHADGADEFKPALKTAGEMIMKAISAAAELGSELPACPCCGNRTRGAELPAGYSFLPAATAPVARQLPPIAPDCPPG